MSSQQQWKQLDEFNLFAPDPTTENTTQIDLNAIRAIASLCTGLPIPEHIISDDMICLSINALGSNITTPAKEALGTFTHRKLKKLDNWDGWLQAEQKQLDQFHDLEIFGDPTPLPHKAILLRPHWNYVIQKSGES